MNVAVPSPAALAWETAFLHLSATRLADMAAAADLNLSYSSERSVEDELGRESGADGATVALSYVAMLACATQPFFKSAKIV